MLIHKIGMALIFFAFLFPIALMMVYFYRVSTIKSAEKLQFVAGGVERSDSVLAGLNAIRDKAQDDDWVLVHDAAPRQSGPQSRAYFDAAGKAIMLPIRGGMVAFYAGDINDSTQPFKFIEGAILR